jgi:CRISPR-associated endonuclease Csn1
MIRETTPAHAREPVVLGLDIGAKSIGWALIRSPEADLPEIVAAGVRIFEAGVDGDIEKGMDGSRAAARRMARQMRRQTARRVQKKKRLFSLLQEAGLLPNTADHASLSRDEAIKALDRSLLASLGPQYGESGATANKLPYVLRAEALRRPLSAYELGRVLYHLGERRGFKSNRRTDRKTEDTGKVYDGIAEVRSKKGDHTLGEYFAGLDPKVDRIRNRYLARSDYEEEFARIWETQRLHHDAVLTPRLHRKVKRCLFWQRPLKSQKGLLGRCSLLTNRKRCPIAHPVAQEFRLLQAVNNLLVLNDDGIASPLTDAQRNSLLKALRTDGDLTFPAVKKLLGMKPRGTRFNLEEGGEKRLPGNRTHKAMHDAIGDAWDALGDAGKTQLVGIVRGSVDAAALRGQLARWFPELACHCEALEKVSLEDAYASHCKKVLVDLIDRMKDGIPYATARADFEATHNLGGVTEPVDQLPPVRTYLPGLTNPAVIRSLTELRKVVNEIVRIHGKPDMVRIELARDLKKSRKSRQEIAKRMREREGERSRATQQLRSHGITNPSRADIEKVLLADECGWMCPYTGVSFGMGDLVGEHAKVDVEHIYPRRYLDDSFLNKTLCIASENRAVKKDRLPLAAYGGQPARYAEILDRVRAFRSEMRDEKVRRFMADAVDADFVSRQLVDTAYASREAAKYVGLLYGGVIDVRSDRRVRTSSGRLSALLRSAWKLNSILGTDDSPKGRGVDHRHHAVDAIVIALTSERLVKAVSDSAERYAARSSGHWRVEVPEHAGLLEQAMTKLKAIVVSHRVDRRLAGRLHEDSIYSPPRQDGNGGEFHVIRKPLARLTRDEIEGDSIVDPRVRATIRHAYNALRNSLGRSEPSVVFGNDADLPALPNRNGPPVPIRKVRVRVKDRAEQIAAQDYRKRHIMRDSDGLHHTAIFCDTSGKKRVWMERPTSRLQVQDRRRQSRPIVETDCGGAAGFEFHLCKGDSIELDDPQGGRTVYIVRGVAERFIRVVPAWEASQNLNNPDYRIRTPNKFGERNARVVVVTPAGRVFARGG